MAVVVIEGLIAVILVLAGLRTAIMNAVPLTLKLSIGVGIGLFITFVGLRDGGIVVNDPATGIALGNLTSGPALIALAGIGVGIALTARGFRGAVLVAVLTTTALGLIFGVLDGPSGVAEWPGSAGFETIGDALKPSTLADAFTWALVPLIFALFMSDFFDTIGTAVAVSTAGGLNDEHGDPPHLRRLLLVDSGSAALGGAMGVSSVTAYVESGAGVSEGARTGLANLVTGGLFFLTIVFVPLIAVVGQSVPYVGGTTVAPAIAPALVLVGFLMIQLVAEIDWKTPEHALPAFLIIVGVPMTFSIAAGIGLGVIGYAVVMVARGRGRDVGAVMWLMVALFGVYFASDWLQANVF
jgi:AGZA family xanthine/uracil permease-like MFS transporter